MTMLVRFLAAFALLWLSACGGGGGNSGSSPLGGGGGGGGGGDGSTPQPTMTVAVAPASVTSLAPGTVTARVVSAAGAALPGQLVQFSTQLGLGKFDMASALTDADGVASVTIRPATNQTAGGDLVLATTTVGGKAISAAAGVQMVATAAPTAEPAITVSVAPTTVTAASPGTVKARVVSATGAAVAGQVVQFSTQLGLGRFSAPSALTDADGVASVTVTPTTNQTVGADLVVAKSTVGGTAIMAAAGFQLTATNVTIDGFAADIGAAALAPYGQTTLSVALSNGAQGNPVNIAVSSSCVSRGLATLTPASATTSTGSATFMYRDNGCGADRTDTLQASITGSAATRTLSLNLTAPTVSSIRFVSASPAGIYLKGSGFVENSTVIFQVADASGNGVRGQSVNLSPSTVAGGLQLEGISDITQFPITRVSDANGNVIVRINSGTVPTPVRVVAATTVGGVAISTVSSTLAVAVGLPSQLNFSLSQKTLNIEGYNIDGTKNSYTVIASDRLGNPVPDGTAINLVTTGGQVQSIVQTATAGGLSQATAAFQSSQPRPSDGRITVLAYAIGEKSFLDTNGNNVYDTGEPFQDLGDPFLNRRFNGIYDPANDQYFSLGDPSATQACAVPASPLLARDVSIPSRPQTCTGAWGRAYVRRAVQTIFSTSSAGPRWGLGWPASAYAGNPFQCPNPANHTLVKDNFGAPNPAVPAYNADGSANPYYYRPFGALGLYGLGGSGTLSFFVADANPVAFNPMPAGTTIAVSGTKGLTVNVVGGSPVPSTTSPSSATINYSFAPDTTSGTLSVTFTSPGGLATTVSQFLSMDAAPGGAVQANVGCPQ
ncbi:MAG: hypothetical protein AMXMBFR66_03920 [Pseudomonadota bacterium]|nr:hypothetical protein [Rubrivivax sp.]